MRKRPAADRETRRLLALTAAALLLIALAVVYSREAARSAANDRPDRSIGTRSHSFAEPPPEARTTLPNATLGAAAARSGDQASEADPAPAEADALPPQDDGVASSSPGLAPAEARGAARLRTPANGTSTSTAVSAAPTGGLRSPGDPSRRDPPPKTDTLRNL